MVSSPSLTHLHLPLLTTHAVPSYSRMHKVKRLQAVRRYEVLATAPDGAYDRITALAARLFKVPIAIVSIVDAGRIWFKFHQCDQIQPGRGNGNRGVHQRSPERIRSASGQKVQLSVSQ